MGVLGNPSAPPKARVMVAVKGHGLLYYNSSSNSNSNNKNIQEGDSMDHPLFTHFPRNIPQDWHMKNYDWWDGSKTNRGDDSSDGVTKEVRLEQEQLQAGIDYPLYVLSRRSSSNKNPFCSDGRLPPPLPFGPNCPPTKLCCGSKVKYFPWHRGAFPVSYNFQQLSRNRSSGFVPGVDGSRAGTTLPECYASKNLE